VPASHGRDSGHARGTSPNLPAMAKRAEEKERRRRERLAAEQAAARAAKRKRTLQIGAGALLTLAAIGAVVIVLAGGDDAKTADAGDLASGAKAAGCTFGSFRSEGRDHTDSKVTYKTNPPTSGPHNPVAAQDGIYAAGNEPEKESWVHALEHGRVLFQYGADAPAADVAKLRALAQEELKGSAGYHTLLFRNNTKMKAEYAAVAWTKSLTCDELTPQALDVMRDFRAAYTDKAPEFIP
jgi:Protein of unknown function (DUF3105)